MEETPPKGRPNEPETSGSPGSSTPPAQVHVRPSLRSTSNSSTSAFVFSSLRSPSGSPDLLSTSPPYPDPTSLPTSPSYEAADPNASGSGLGKARNRDASEGSARPTSEAQIGSGHAASSSLDAGFVEVGGSSARVDQFQELGHKHSPLLTGQTGRESLGTISRRSTIRSTSNFLGRVGLSPTLDFGRSRREASEEPDRVQADMAGGQAEGEARRLGKQAEYQERRASLSTSSSTSSPDEPLEDGSGYSDGGADGLGTNQTQSRHITPERATPSRHGSLVDSEHLPELPTPEQDDYDDSVQDEVQNDVIGTGAAESNESNGNEANGEPDTLEARGDTAEEAYVARELADGGYMDSVASTGSSLQSHSRTASADFLGAFRRVRPRISPSSGIEPSTSPERSNDTFGLPRSTSSSSSNHRTVKANPTTRTPLAGMSTSPSKRHSLAHSFTHSRSSSHTSTTMSTSPDKSRGLANGRSGHKGKGKGRAEAANTSPSKASKSLWEDVPAEEDAASDADSEEARIDIARSPERHNQGDELDERIRQAEEKIRLSAMSRASRPRSSLSTEPDSQGPSPSKSQVRQCDTYRRHNYTPGGADTLRRSVTMGSAERPPRARTPIKQEPGDWVQGLEEQGEQRESGSSSNSGKRKPLPAEFRQSSQANSLFTPSPKLAAPGLPRRQSQLYDSPTSAKSAQSRFLESPSLSHRELDRTRSSTPASKRYSETVSRSGSGSQYGRHQWSESISGLPAQAEQADRYGTSATGLPTLRPDRRAESVVGTVRDQSRYRSNPSTLSSRAPLTPGDSVSAVGVPPYARASGGARGSSIMPSHAQSEAGLGSAKKDKDPLDVLRRMEQTREASKRQWQEDRAASVLGHSTADAYRSQRPESRADHTGHGRGESRQYTRPATSMSSLRDVYERDAPRTAPADRRQSRRYDDADPMPVVQAWDVDSPLAQRRQGRHMSLAPGSGPPRTDLRHMRSSTSLGGRSSTSASMANGGSALLGSSKTAHGKLLFEAAQALEGRLPMTGDKAVELVRAVRGSVVAAEATNQLVRDISIHLTGGLEGREGELIQLAAEIREASKKSDLAVRELTRVLLDLPRLLRDVQSHGQQGPSYHSRQEGSSGTGETGNRYTPSRLSVIRDDPNPTSSAYRNRFSYTPSLDEHNRAQSAAGTYSRHGATGVEAVSPTRNTGNRQQSQIDRISPSKVMRPSTSLGGIVDRLRSPKKDPLPPLDDARSSIAGSPDIDARGGAGQGGSTGRSALDMLRRTSVRDSSSRLRRVHELDRGDEGRGTQSMDVARSDYVSPSAPPHRRAGSYSPSKESVTSDHTATTSHRTNGVHERDDRMQADSRQSLRKKASIISTNTVRAVSGFAPGLMSKLPPATPATSGISYITAGDISPTVAHRRDVPRGSGSPMHPDSARSAHSYKSSVDSRFGDVRTSLDEVESSSPVSRYGLANRKTRMPDLDRTDSGVSARSGADDLEQGMRQLGIGRPAAPEEQSDNGDRLEKSKLARLTSWRLKR